MAKKLHLFSVAQHHRNRWHNITEISTYTCPSSKTLNSIGKWYTKSRGKSVNMIKQYTTKECKSCPLSALCTNNKGGRMLERSEHADLIEANRIRNVKFKDLYRRRQAIVEHPYGIIKRQWGFSYIITKKSIKRASADIGLIFTVYNLRRIINILGHDKLKAILKAFFLCFNLQYAHFKTLWRIQIINVRYNYFKIECRISKLISIFSPEIKLKMILKGGC